MEQNVKISRNVSNKATILGVMLILFGLIYMASQAGLIDHSVKRVLFSWQMLLIAIGILSLSDRNYGWGTTLIVIGGVFMYKRYTGHGIDYLWPLIIIVAGLFLIFSRKGKNIWSGNMVMRSSAESSTAEYLNETAIFGGNEKIVRSDNFKGGSVLSVFGGSTIDLTQCTLQPGETVTVDMTSILGGSTLIVPPDWNTRIEVTSILGGFSDKRYHHTVDKSKALIVRGIAILGGGEIK